MHKALPSAPVAESLRKDVALADPLGLPAALDFCPAGTVMPPGGKDGGDGKVGRSKPPLETVIGFSDGRDFTARVGPQAARSQEGKFAAAVAITTVVVPSGLVRRNSGGAGTGPGAEAGGPLSPRGSGGLSSSGGSGELGRSPEVKPQLQAFVEKIRKEPPRAGSGGLYELLPPPGK